MEAYIFPQHSNYHPILIIVKDSNYYVCWNYEKEYCSISQFKETCEDIGFIKELYADFSPNLADKEVVRKCYFIIRKETRGTPIPNNIQMGEDFDIDYKFVQIQPEQFLTNPNPKIRNLIKKWVKKIKN